MLPVCLVTQNVSDQVRLWEAETKRMRAEPSMFYDGAWEIGGGIVLHVMCL